MPSLTALLSKWPIIRQIRERADGTGIEAMSDNTRAMHARIDDAQVARSTGWLIRIGGSFERPTLAYAAVFRPGSVRGNFIFAWRACQPIRLDRGRQSFWL